MQFQLPIHIEPINPPVTYTDKIMLIGSCFTEHIGNYLSKVKFKVLQNPNGILFDPLSVCNSLITYIDNKQYNEKDLFYLNDGWHSWQHHSRFSNPEKEVCLNNINTSKTQAHQFLKQADWLIITLGTSFVYNFSEEVPKDLNKHDHVHAANCHKAPAKHFNKTLCTIEQIVAAFDEVLYRLLHFNENLKIIFTVSPVRHARDGVVENNRSKARLIESVHHMVHKFDNLYYFPAYEIVIDVLRDYRFYDIDLVHPNYAATEYVLDKFAESCISRESQVMMEEIRKIIISKNHKPFNPASDQHKAFLQRLHLQTSRLQEKYPYLDLEEETKVL